MHALFGKMRRLHDRGSQACGLVVDAEGVMLGPDCVLVRRTPQGFRCAGAGQIGWIKRNVFADDPRLQGLERVLASIAKALDAGDLVKAQLLGLEISLDPLDDGKLRRLRFVADLLKAGFDPSQSRDERGRWTSEGDDTGAAATGSSPVGSASGAAGAPGSSGMLGYLAPEVAPFLADVVAPLMARAAATLSAPAVFLGALLIPTNRSNVSEGALADAPGITYRNDEGILTLYHVGDDGQKTAFFEARPDADGLYRDQDGNVVGKNLGAGKGIVLDPNALRPVIRTDEERQAEAEAALEAYRRAVDREPRICPDPSRDRGGLPSAAASLYQLQNCGLPGGWGVLFNGKRYDGCDPETGVLRECKGLGYDSKIKDPDGRTDEDVFEAWFINSGGLREVQREMQGQSMNALGRPVTWDVAEPNFTAYLDRHARANGYANVDVRLTPPSAEVRALRKLDEPEFIDGEAWS